MELLLEPCPVESENRSSNETESQFENESQIETASKTHFESGVVVNVVVIVIRNI